MTGSTLADSRMRVGLVPLLVAALTLADLACEDDYRHVNWAEIPTSIEVHVTAVSGSMGTPDAPLPISDKADSAGGVPVEISLKMHDALNQGVLPWTGWVRLSVRPGRLSVASGAGVAGNDVYVENGVRDGIKATIIAAFGKTRIWGEDVGFVPRTVLGVSSACENGIDDDEDGLTDHPGDMGCESTTDDDEGDGSRAAGVGEVIYLANPDIAQVQGYAGASPFSGETVMVDSGNLVVTHVTTSGMYVTDISDTSNRYNHLYVFSFNTPMDAPLCETDEYDSANCLKKEPVRLHQCDRLQWVSGIVSEFYKFTELGFPSWETILWDPALEECPIPEPIVLIGDDFTGHGTTPIESAEAALVRIENVVPARAEGKVDCDFNSDGAVDFEDYGTGECTAECQCRLACEDDPLCTEINALREYGQWPVSVNGVKVWIYSRDAVPDFDSYNPETPGTIRSITGVLKNLSFLQPTAWIIEPRCMDDITLSGEPMSSTEACVETRTGE